MGKSTKVRPVLSTIDIQYLIAAVTEYQSKVPNPKLLAALKLYAIKVDMGVVTPAYQVKGAKSMEDKLGLSEDVSMEQAYLMWKMNPESCSQEITDLAADYRYLNDLMTEEEEIAYEARD